MRTGRYMGLNLSIRMQTNINVHPTERTARKLLFVTKKATTKKTPNNGESGKHYEDELWVL